MDPLHYTPLHARHIALKARMAPFAGWEMPIQYEGILAEHQYTRTRASIFDTCHMGEFDIRGPRARTDLERLLTQHIATLETGRCRYGFMLNDDGGVIDDLTCYRRADDHFFLVVNAGTLAADKAWLQAHLSADTRFSDRSPGRAKLDIQGPDSRRLMEKILGTPMPELKYFGFTDAELAGVPMTISRTGYTGEWGYELYFPEDEAGRIWDLLTASGDIKPAGLGARDTLRLEMGYPLYGHELNAVQTPYGATRGAFIHLDKEFVGKEAVTRDAAHPGPVLVGLALASKRAARAHDKVLRQGAPVGEVTSGSLAPSLDRAVAMAYVDAGISEPGTSLEIEVRGTPLPATVVAMPFYKQGTARKKHIS